MTFVVRFFVPSGVEVFSPHNFDKVLSASVEVSGVMRGSNAIHAVRTHRFPFPIHEPFSAELKSATDAP